MSEFGQSLHGNALALGIATTLAIGNVFIDDDEAHARAMADGNAPAYGEASDRPDWPEIDPSAIDGYIDDGGGGQREVPVQFEKNLAASCRINEGISADNMTQPKFKLAGSRAVKTTFEVAEATSCNKYGQRIITLTAETRDPDATAKAARKWRSGKPVLIKTHESTVETEKLALAQKVTSKNPLDVRIVAKASYTNYDGKMSERTYRYDFETLPKQK